jgi:hypothetical protein
MDAAAAQFDEEEHVQPLQPDRLDGEEVNREHALAVRAQELALRVLCSMLGLSSGRFR